MIRHGMEVRCDRCGRIEFFTNKWGVSSEMMLDNAGWGKRLDKELCSDCLKTFDSMTEKFFNEIWDK